MPDFLFAVDITQEDGTVDTITVDITNVNNRGQAIAQLNQFLNAYIPTKYQRGTQPVRGFAIRDQGRE